MKVFVLFAAVHGFHYETMQKVHVAMKSVIDQDQVIDGMQALEADAYIAMGLAKVFKTTDDGIEEMMLIEPLTAGTLETLDLGVPTSYCRILASTMGDVFDENNEVKLSAMNDLTQGDSVSICENMSERAQAAARTFRRRPDAQILELGQVRDDFNFNTDRKRVINQVYEPSFDDNVKQDASIDVYNRNEDEDKLSDEIKRLAET